MECSLDVFSRPKFFCNFKGMNIINFIAHLFSSALVMTFRIWQHFSHTISSQRCYGEGVRCNTYCSNLCLCCKIINYLKMLLVAHQEECEMAFFPRKMDTSHFWPFERMKGQSCSRSWKYTERFLPLLGQISGSQLIRNTITQLNILHHPSQNFESFSQSVLKMSSWAHNCPPSAAVWATLVFS